MINPAVERQEDKISMSAVEIQALARQPQNAGSFTLYRADTHGTETAIITNVSEIFAHTVMMALEEKPHHQGYWVRPVEAQPS